MPGLVECVPNFSQGRDMDVIKRITDAIEGVEGAKLLDVDPGADTNRTVVTFVAPPETVGEAAFQAVKKARELIDMSKHTGAHPRMGATDVCPFVPVAGVTMDDCARIARETGKRIGEELGIPVYLYEHAASREEFRNLANVREGEYEGLRDRFVPGADPKWNPDFGPASFNARSGATAVGAREFLIAYNVNLNTREKRYATDIAFEIREKGRSVREGDIDPWYYRGEIVRDEAGKPLKKEGTFSHCKAIGWFIDDFGIAQISINLTNYKVTPPHLVLEEVRRLAARRGLVVTGSEIVGLVPYQAMLDAGRYYLERQERSTAIPDRDVIAIAIRSMGLTDVSDFDPETKIIGWPDTALEPEGALRSMTLKGFADELSRESPAPGGGSIAALAGALGAALGAMVVNLTLPKQDYAPVHAELHGLGKKAQELKDRLMLAVDTDTDAFNAVLGAMRMPKGTDEEKAVRDRAVQEGYKEAVMVPYTTASRCLEALRLCRDIAEKGNEASVTDAGVGALMSYSGIIGAVYNVRINFREITDEDFKKDIDSRCQGLEEEGARLAQETWSIVQSKL